jgi:predicted nuclease with TOPRIM domain
MVEGSYGELKVEIENIKEDIQEIKQDNKETKEFYQTVIAELKENTIKQTEILNHQISSQEKQFAQVNTDIDGLTDKVDKFTTWGIKILIGLLLIVSGLRIAGVDISTILGL